MTDVSYLEAFLILAGSLLMWLSGFYNGKWAGMQKAEKRYRANNRMRESVNKF